MKRREREQRRQNQLQEMRQQMRKTDQADDFGVVSEFGRADAHRFMLV
jgi:hypothetical protein